MLLSSCLPISSPGKHPRIVPPISSSIKTPQHSKAGVVRCGESFPLRPELMPDHVTVILDGNRRWASERGLAVEEGHSAGAKVFREMGYLFQEMGVKVLSVFALSTENWGRQEGEIEHLISICEEAAVDFNAISTVMRPRASVIGDTSKLPQSLRKKLTLIEKITKTQRGLHGIVALNYGGRQDIIEATKAIASKVVDGKLSPEEINENSFAKELQTKCTEYPYPDLLIRTSGERRLSNFMLWQMANTELYFVDKCFPDMQKQDFMEALITYQDRKKHFE